MKTFSQFLKEEVSPFALTSKGIIDINDEDVRDNINALLNGVTDRNSPTPYTALEHVKKVLANFHIFLPRTPFLEGDSGYEVWPVNQFGEKVGMDDDGQFKKASDSPYFMFFEWQMCDDGTFKIFSEIVNQSELDELMSDVEDEFTEGEDEEMEDDEDEDDDLHNINEVSSKTLKSYADKKKSRLKSSYQKIKSNPDATPEDIISYNKKFRRDTYMINKALDKAAKKRNVGTQHSDPYNMKNK